MDAALDAVRLTMPGGREALAGVSLRIGHGERVAIIGASGAGKTSLLRVLGLALRPGAGEVSLDAARPWSLPRPALKAVRARIGMIHQAPPLPQRQRVVTAVLAGRLGRWSFWRGLGSLAYPVDLPGAREALARLELADRLFDRCDRLSGGQLQRVGVARVLYQQPDLILADEPVSSLDPELAHQTVAELNREALARGVTLVASLHAVDLALNQFPRVVGLREGAIAFDLPPVKVSEAMLRELYATEATVIPTQDNQPLAPPDRRPRAAQPLCR